MAAVRKFNTAGPVVAADHYCIPPLERIDLDAVLGLIRDKKYFVLHAPRQTGKTSALLALRDLLNGSAQGEFRCVYANVEAGQAMRDNVTEGMRTVLSQFALRASLTLGDDTLERVCSDAMNSAGPGGALNLTLSRWAAADRKPLVLLIDEIDSLVGDTLLAVLRQLRSGYDQRPAAFPHSIILCGVRDVRDYRMATKRRRSTRPPRTGWCSAAAPSTSSPNHCDWATSRSGRYGHCWRSTPTPPGRHSRRRRRR